MRTLRRIPLLLLGFWAMPALVAVAGFQVVPSARNPGISLPALAASQLLVWFAWALWSLIIIAVCERFPFGRGRITVPLAVHVPLSLVVIAAQILVTAFVSSSFDLSPRRGLESTLAIGLRSYGDLFVVIYWAIVGAHAAFRWHGAWQAQGLVAARLERDLSEAQLTTLRSQLNPHFLFNALNSVVTLIPRDQDAAARMVVRLADLLRATLGMVEQQEVPLERELDMVRNYLSIELVRFPDRLSVRWDVEEDTRRARVPAFVLQPLVENAIVHGIARRSGRGEIVVTARRRGEMLELSVRDNGPGPASAPHGARRSGGAGIGLANLRARLQRLYVNAGADVVLSGAEGEGAVATITVPLQLPDDSEPSGRPLSVPASAA